MLAQFYNDTINYYDKGDTSLSQVIREKAAYMKRWPQRNFTFLDIRLLKTENPVVKKAICIMRWEVSNDKKTLSGISEAEYLLRMDGGDILILGESSKVLSRD